MRIILSEGSGLTSRQTARRLGELGHEVELLSSSNLCLSRFTRHVRAVHPVPKFGSDPFGWLRAAIEIVKTRRADLLFPTQEQVTILSAQEKHLTVPTIVPPFASLQRMQDKISAYRTLVEIGAPQPQTVEIVDSADFERVVDFPVFVKRPISTASSGVRQAKTLDELVVVANKLGLGSNPLIAQTQVSGPFAMVQAVADRGRLIAYHANLRVKEGIGGGAAIKQSVSIQGLAVILKGMISSLEWHGGLSMDLILTDRGPMIIDINPRLVEPANAFFSGVDLVGAMLDLATSDKAKIQPTGRVGVLSHQTLLSILRIAEQTGSRRAVAREALDAFFLRGAYFGSMEELTPVAGDPIAAIPVLAALAATIANPSLWRKFQGGAVGAYAVTPQAWEEIVASGSTRRVD
jgi:glutathione synthase/RimK-type ligase-like ATP-grasp enzyme